MTYPLRNLTRIHSQSIPLQKGYKLGTSATWKNIKKQATNSYNLIKDTDLTSQDTCSNHNVEIGLNNEVFIYFDGLLEIWQFNPQNDLILINQFDLKVATADLESFKILGTLDTGYRILFVFKELTEYRFQIIQLNISTDSLIGHYKLTSELMFPSHFLEGPFHLKVSSSFFIVVNKSGVSKVFQNNSKLVPITVNLVAELNEINEPILDLVNNWVVLSLNEENLMNLKSLLNDNVNSKNQFTLTCLKLPQKKHLLQKLLLNLSNTAIDGFLKLSDASSKKILKYLNKNKPIDQENGTKSESKEDGQTKINPTFIQSTLNSLLNQSKKGSLIPTSKQMLCIIDLKNSKILSIFKPPEGITHVSLSPYDLSLATVNKRGNILYLYDLSKLPKEISIIGSFTKGKTKSTVRQIIWFKNNKAVGFTTNPSGSIHWFNLVNKHQSPKDQSISKDNWILSSINSLNLSVLNNQSIISVNNSKEVFFINYLNGEYSSKIDIPKEPVDISLIEDYGQNTLHDNIIESDNSDPLSKVEIETCSPYPNLYNDNYFNISTYKFDKDEEDTEVNEKSDLGENDARLFLKLYENFGNNFNINEIFFKSETTEEPGDVNNPNDAICIGDGYFDDLIIDQGDDVIKF